MPFQIGSISVRRYRVLGQVPVELERTATVSIRGRSWRPIDEKRGEKESFGWVNPRDLLEPQFDWEDVVISHGLVLLGIRRDRKDFSKVLFRARRARLFSAVMAEKKIQKLSRQQRLALEEQLAIDMLRETSPRSQFSEMLWDMNSGIVLMGATSNALCERIADLFEATFDLKLRVMFPALAGAEFIQSQGLDREYELATAHGLAATR